MLKIHQIVIFFENCGKKAQRPESFKVKIFLYPVSVRDTGCPMYCVQKIDCKNEFT